MSGYDYVTEPPYIDENLMCYEKARVPFFKVRLLWCFSVWLSTVISQSQLQMALFECNVFLSFQQKKTGKKEKSVNRSKMAENDTQATPVRSKLPLRCQN